MLTCIACSKLLKSREAGSVEQRGNIKQGEEESDSLDLQTPATKHAIKSLTSQIKDIALKASGAYRNCKPCSGSSNTNHCRKYAESDATSDSSRFQWYRRPGSSNSTPKMWGKGLEARLGSLASGEGTPSSLSGRTDSVVCMEEDEPKEWVAQVETGVLITFVSLPGGGNDLRRIRFSREMYSKWQAQKWWSENYEKVMELYNVRQFDNQAVPLSNPPRSGDESSRLQSAKESPVTPLGKEHLRDIHHPTGMGYCSSDLLDHRSIPSRQCHNSTALASTPKLSSISGAKTEASSLDGSERTGSSREAYHSGELSISNASEMETEWVEQDEPGVYITIRALVDGTRELRRVRFSRERFGEAQARLWWEENRARIQEQYL